MMNTLLGGKANSLFKFVCLVVLATPFLVTGCGSPDYENAEPTAPEDDPMLQGTDTTKMDEIDHTAPDDPAISGGT